MHHYVPSYFPDDNYSNGILDLVSTLLYAWNLSIYNNVQEIMMTQYENPFVLLEITPTV